MANVILGLLIINEQSFYDLIKSFRAGISLFYSASSGSIKRALDGLLAGGLIEVASVEAGARGRKAYRVTEAGRGEFAAWMEGELLGADAENEMLSRLFFLALVAPDRRATVLARITHRLESDLATLGNIQDRLDQDSIPEGYAEVADFQRRTLGYGIASHRFALDWVRAEYEL